jgi:hypothetical protein
MFRNGDGFTIPTFLRGRCLQPQVSALSYLLAL